MKALKNKLLFYLLTHIQMIRLLMFFMTILCLRLERIGAVMMSKARVHLARPMAYGLTSPKAIGSAHKPNGISHTFGMEFLT